MSPARCTAVRSAVSFAGIWPYLATAPLNTLALLVPIRVCKLHDRWDRRIGLAALLLVSGAEA
ncbi:hypothetical protein [Streptomyces sp. NPDC058424]|uniref:hypothetical protein n=1 Tax=Streptomyces sp. NPDC058424 TaxID=3346491 RepID=UPI003667CF30